MFSFCVIDDVVLGRRSQRSGQRDDRTVAVAHSITSSARESIEPFLGTVRACRNVSSRPLTEDQRKAGVVRHAEIAAIG